MANDLKINFVPINNDCYGCGGEVKKYMRQDMTWDRKNQCRRVCESCINKGFLDGKFAPKGKE